jgi:hypothetical protein
MKRKILYAAGFVMMAVTLNSCEGLFETCKICKSVTYENGNVVSEGSGTEYCGAGLITIEAMAPVIIGNRTTQWECS